MAVMDWKQIIADIQRHGKLTQQQIAQEVGSKQATISDLHNGTTRRPNYELGAALLALLERLQKQEA